MAGFVIDDARIVGKKRTNSVCVRAGKQYGKKRAQRQKCGFEQIRWAMMRKTQGTSPFWQYSEGKYQRKMFIGFIFKKANQFNYFKIRKFLLRHAIFLFWKTRVSNGRQR